MAFDPCREWLGIDAVELGDPARVLGLPPDCRDAVTIGRAAETRLTRLRQVAPGPFAKAHAALVARVEEARDTLLAAAFTNGASARAPDPRPSFAPQPRPLEPSTPHWADTDDGGGSRGGFPASDETEPAAGPMVRRSAPRSRGSSSGAGGLLLTSFALLAAAVAVLLFLMLRPDLFDKQVARTSTGNGGSPAATGTKPKGDASPARPKTPPPPKRPDPEPATPQVDRGAEPAAPDRRPEPEDRPSPSPSPSPDTDMQRADTEQRAQEAERLRREKEEQVRREKEEQARREAEMAEQKAVAAAREAEEARRKAEMAAAEGTQQVDQERARMQEALDKSLGDAFKALQRGEFDTADRTIKAAENFVGDDVEAATRIERWRLLATYAREFVGFREQAIAAANAGREFQVDGKTFAVIEITPDMFIYKMAGKTERVPREAVDPRIELAVVEGWFEADGRAANHLFLGARWLSLDPPNPSRARNEWRKAGDGGEQVAPLNALLDDPVIRRAGR